jgi:hypothetical protein
VGLEALSRIKVTGNVGDAVADAVDGVTDGVVDSRKYPRIGDDTGSLEIGVGSRSSDHTASSCAYDYDRFSIGTIGVIADDCSRGWVSSRISSRTMIANNRIFVRKWALWRPRARSRA